MAARRTHIRSSTLHPGNAFAPTEPLTRTISDVVTSTSAAIGTRIETSGRPIWHSSPLATTPYQRESPLATPKPSGLGGYIPVWGWGGVEVKNFMHVCNTCFSLGIIGATRNYHQNVHMCGVEGGMTKKQTYRSLTPKRGSILAECCFHFTSPCMHFV
jgi:hypothetical protein